MEFKSLIPIFAKFLAVSLMVNNVVWPIFTINRVTSAEPFTFNEPMFDGSGAESWFIIVGQVFLALQSALGLCICVIILRNKGRWDKSTGLFLTWLGGFIVIILSNKVIATYVSNRWIDNDGQMGYMQAILFKAATLKNYVYSFERFQVQHHCCGIFGPKDWDLAAALPDNQQPIIYRDYGLGVPPPEKLDRIGTCTVKNADGSAPKGCGKFLLDALETRLTDYAITLQWQFGYGIFLVLLIAYCCINSVFVRDHQLKLKMHKQLEEMEKKNINSYIMTVPVAECHATKY